MTDYSFKEGDIVYLKSGGPAMTISHIEYVRKEIPGWLCNTSVPTTQINLVSCHWFNNDGHASSKWFQPCVLTYVDPQVRLFKDYFGSVA